MGCFYHGALFSSLFIFMAEEIVGGELSKTGAAFKKVLLMHRKASVDTATKLIKAASAFASSNKTWQMFKFFYRILRIANS